MQTPLSKGGRLAVAALLVLAAVGIVYTLLDDRAHGELTNLWWVAGCLVLAGFTYWKDRNSAGK